MQNNFACNWHLAQFAGAPSFFEFRIICCVIEGPCRISHVSPFAIETISRRCFEIISHFNYLLKFSPVVPDEAQLMDLITRICVKSCGLYNRILQPWNGYIESMTELRLAAKHRTNAGSGGERDRNVGLNLQETKNVFISFPGHGQTNESNDGFVGFCFRGESGLHFLKVCFKILCNFSLLLPLALFVQF